MFIYMYLQLKKAGWQKNLPSAFPSIFRQDLFSYMCKLSLSEEKSKYFRFRIFLGDFYSLKKFTSSPLKIAVSKNIMQQLYCSYDDILLSWQDFKEMVVHHLVTIALLYFSWCCNFVRIGTLVLVVHDAVDYWMAVSQREREMETGDRSHRERQTERQN